MNIITNPNLINPINNPKLVFTSQDNLVSDLIELREDGSWGINGEVSHMMTMTEHGLFNCQDPGGFHQIPISTYMTKGTRIVFIDFVNMNPAAYTAMCLIVSERLGKQGYDWLQIVGQATDWFPIIGRTLSFLHMPGTEDCSEEGVREMKGIAPFLPSLDTDFLNTIPSQSNPQQVLNLCLENPFVFNPFGIYTGS